MVVEEAYPLASSSLSDHWKGSSIVQVKQLRLMKKAIRSSRVLLP